MAFPASPSNNDVHKEGNRAFVWDSTLGVWDQVRETDRTENKTITSDAIAQGNLTVVGDLVSSTALTNRNMIINGGMTVWQRATAATVVSSGYSTVDRWAVYEVSDAVTTTEKYTMSMSELNTTGHGTALKMNVTQVDTSSANASYIFLRTGLEGQDLQQLKYGTVNAKTITLSFWVKSNKIGVYAVTLNKGSTTRLMIPVTYTIVVADTWEKKELVITPTMGGTTFINHVDGRGIINNNNTSGLDINFTLLVGNDSEATADTWVASSSAWGTNAQVNWAENVNNNFYLTGVQLELGSNATPFEHRSYADELARCMRYYQTWGGNSSSERILVSYGQNTSQHRGELTLSPTMRATPTLSVSAAGDFAIERSGTNAVLTGMGFDQASPKVASFTLDRSGGFTAGEGGHLTCNGTTSARIKITAEL